MTKQDISVLGKENAFDLIGKEWTFADVQK